VVEPAFYLVVGNNATLLSSLHTISYLHTNVEIVHRINIGRRVRKLVGYRPEIDSYFRCIHTEIVVNLRLDVNRSKRWVQGNRIYIVGVAI